MEVVDQLTELFYTTADSSQRIKATEELKSLTVFENFSQNLDILKESTNLYTIKFSSCNLTQIFTSNYTVLREVMENTCMQILSILEGHVNRNVYVKIFSILSLNIMIISPIFDKLMNI
jgi:hypothetical protein